MREAWQLSPYFFQIITVNFSRNDTLFVWRPSNHFPPRVDDHGVPVIGIAIDILADLIGRNDIGLVFNRPGSEQRFPVGRARWDRERRWNTQDLCPAPGTQWVGSGTAFQGPRRRLNCTLLARWDAEYKEPWLLLTDLAPSAGEACWYGLRAWIEQGFKITKRGGWQWQRTRMSDPQRAARLWLAVAVATLWLLSVGGLAEDTLPVSTLLPLTDADCLPSRPRRATQLRLVSVFRHGWIPILVALINQRRLPRGRCVPEPWPQPIQSNTLRGTHEILLAASNPYP